MRKRFTTPVGLLTFGCFGVPGLAVRNHGYPNEMVPWLAFPALSPCEADDVWVLVHIL